MMIDWGIDLSRQRELIEIAGSYIDLAKIAVGLAGIIPKRILKEKISIYNDAQIDAFIGGQFLEYGIFNHGLKIAPTYFEEAQQLGFKVIEVSDNNLDIDPKQKYELIRTGKEDFSLKILGEVGSKKEVTSTDAMIQGIKDCINAGAWKVFLEGAEFTSKTDGTLLKEVVENVTKGVELKDIIFELPGRWISNVHGCGIHDMELFLIENFGPNVNIGNVAPDEILQLETLRTGAGVKL
jgi:phosphosulfolactate synthase